MENLGALFTVPPSIDFLYATDAPHSLQNFALGESFALHLRQTLPNGAAVDAEVTVDPTSAPHWVQNFTLGRSFAPQ